MEVVRDMCVDAMCVPFVLRTVYPNGVVVYSAPAPRKEVQAAFERDHRTLRAGVMMEVMDVGRCTDTNMLS